MAATFQSTTAIRAGISSTSYGHLKVFYIAGELYALEGKNLTWYKWDESAGRWYTNTDYAAYDTPPATSTETDVFEYAGNLYLMTKATAGTSVVTYIWNSNTVQWEVNAAMNAGLDPLNVTSSSVAVFYLNSELCCIIGRYDGFCDGYKWNGSQWVLDTPLSTGFTDIGSSAFITSFEFGGDRYLISATTGFKWNSENNQWDTSDISNGLAPYGNYPCPTAFIKDGILYCIYETQNGISAWNYLASVVLSSIDVTPNENQNPQITVTVTEEIGAGENFVAYFAPSVEDVGNPDYLVELTANGDLTYSGETSANDGEEYYLIVSHYFSGVLISDLDTTGIFCFIEQKDTTVIPVVAPNYLTPPAFSFNHGLLYYDGYIYGSARDSGITPGSGIIKINATDYTQYSITKLDIDESNPSTNGLSGLEQIIKCSGFLWVQISEYLFRIDPSDMSFVVFNISQTAENAEPISTDGTYLYYSGDTSILKLDASLLIDTPATYGYDGTGAVNLPANTILGECANIQLDTIEKAYVHSIIIDDLYIYAAFTTSSNVAGYVAARDQYIYHVQKIRKSDMVTVGDVIIPKTTDDMVQNSEYIFLAPEYMTAYYADFGLDWGFIAIKKTTLEIKYLKALHSDFLQSDDPDLRTCYGVFIFGDTIAVQLTDGYRKTVILDITNVDQWGENFPIGGATLSLYRYTINGSETYGTPNEIVYDIENGFVHLSTFNVPSTFFKFPITEFSDVVAGEPIIQTTLISSTDADATVQGAILDTGQSAMTAVGFRYGTDPGNLATNVPATLGDVFTETLLSLTPGVYYIQAWGTNTEGTWYGNIVPFSTYNVLQLAYNSDDAVLNYINKLFGCSIRCVQDAPGVPDGTTGTATDSEGNTYTTIVINEKRWFGSNLKTAKFRTGEDVPEVIPAATWAALNSAGRCKYE